MPTAGGAPLTPGAPAPTWTRTWFTRAASVLNAAGQNIQAYGLGSGAAEASSVPLPARVGVEMIIFGLYFLPDGRTEHVMFRNQHNTYSNLYIYLPIVPTREVVKIYSYITIYNTIKLGRSINKTNGPVE